MLNDFHKHLIFARSLFIVGIFCFVTIAFADPRVLNRPIPYKKIPDETTDTIPKKDALVFWSLRGKQILTMTTATGPNPGFCADPARLGLGPGVCRADFLVIQGNRIVHIGRSEFRGPPWRDPAILNILSGIGAASDDIGYIRLGRDQLLMPGLVDSHTHIFNQPEVIIDRDGIPVSRNTSNRQEALRAGQKIAIRNGITSAGNMFVNFDDFSALQTFSSSGDLKVRLSLYLPYTTPGGIVDTPNITDLIPSGITRPWILGDRLRVEGVKIFVDGGSVGRRANSYEQHVGVGDLWFPDDGSGSNLDLNNIVTKFHCNGFQVAMHASGDLAIPLAQAAVRNALSDPSCPGGRENILRHRIEHHQVVTRDIVQADLDTNIGITIPLHTWACDSHIPSADFTKRYHNWDRLLENGVNRGLHVAWHGDDPNFSHWFGMVAPFRELHTAVTRLEIPRSPWQGLDSGLCLLPKQMRNTGLSVTEGLPMMTIEGAYMLHRDREVGSLYPGKLADIIVITKDPLKLARGREGGVSATGTRRSHSTIRAELSDPVHEIRNIHVLMTMIDGHVEFCAKDHENLCAHTH